MNEYTFSGNLEADVSDEFQNLEPKSSFEESIVGRTKMRRQKKSDEENQEGKALKILTPHQMFIRLPNFSSIKSRK